MTEEKKRGRKKGSRNTASQTYARFYQVAKGLGMIPKKGRGSSGTGITKPYVNKLRKYAVREGISIDELERRFRNGELEKYRSDVRSKSITESVDEIKARATAAKTMPVPLEEKKKVLSSVLMDPDFNIQDLKVRGQILKETAMAIVTGKIGTEEAKIIVSIMKTANAMFPDYVDDTVQSIIMNTVIGSRAEALEFMHRMETEEEDFIDLKRGIAFSWDENKELQTIDVEVVRET